MNDSGNQLPLPKTMSRALRAALGLGSIALISACGGGGGGEGVGAPVSLGAALPDQGNYIAIEQKTLSLSESARTGSIQVARIGSAKGASMVSYRFVAGSADATTDFRGSNGMLSWDDGERDSKTVSFLVASDVEAESAEDFTIEISYVTGEESLGVNDSVNVTIEDAACSATVPAMMASNTALTAPCYHLKQAALVGSSGQLQVAPGTTIIADEGASITVGAQATLNLEGTAELPVFVKSASNKAGSWDGFLLKSSSALHRVQHAEVSGAVNAFELTSGGFAAFDHNVLMDNTGAGVLLPMDAAETLGTNNVFLNTTRGIELEGRNIAENHTVRLPKQSTHYVLGGLINNGTLALSAGTDVRMAANAQILVFSTGSVNAIGTAEDPISIEGLEATPGYWDGIHYISSTSEHNRFEHVNIAHGGGDPARKGNIIVDGLNTAITMQHCALTHSAGYGVVYDSNAFQVDLTEVTFSDNVLGEQSL